MNHIETVWLAGLLSRRVAPQIIYPGQPLPVVIGPEAIVAMRAKK